MGLANSTIPIIIKLLNKKFFAKLNPFEKLLSIIPAPIPVIKAIGIADSVRRPYVLSKDSFWKNFSGLLSQEG